MTPVNRQELFGMLPIGQRPIRDAASGKIALITRDRNMNFRGTTRQTAALGAWEDTFGNLTKGLSNLGNSVANIIGSIKGNTTIVNPTTGYPQNQMNPYMPYYPSNPLSPAYNYPVQPQYTAPKTNNTALYTALGVAAFGLIVLLKK